MTAANSIYCIYSDSDVAVGLTSPEHIIPLALGGTNAFTVQVTTAINSRFGHEIDGPVANDPLLSMKRARLGLRGQSKKPAQAKWKRTRDERGNPLQAVIDSGGLKFFDPKQGRNLTDIETQGQKFVSEFRIDPHIRIPFAAKVALATGYFVFGDKFRKYAAHGELRALLKPFREIPHELLRANRVSYFDPIFDAKNDRKRPDHLLLEALITATKGSAVIIGLSPSSIIFVIGLFGEWFATITTPADTSEIPVLDDYDLGHVIVSRGGKLYRGSFRSAVQGLKNAMDGKRDNAGSGQ